jgi:hypothetical protein
VVEQAQHGDHAGAHDDHEQRGEQAQDEREEDLDGDFLRLLLGALTAPQPLLNSLDSRKLRDSCRKYGYSQIC